MISHTKGKNASDEVSSSPGLIQDRGRRLPTVISPEGYDQLTYLTDEEKRLGVELFEIMRTTKNNHIKQPPEHEAVQAHNPTWLMYTADPELYRNYCTFYDEWIGLVCGISQAATLEATDVDGAKAIAPENLQRYHMIMLITTKIAHLYQDAWCLRLMSTMTAWELTKEQYCCLGHPESAIWNEEERLALEFTEAAVNRAVTDELFARAEKYWGRKQLMRYSSYIAHYIGLILMGHINISDAEKSGEVSCQTSGARSSVA